MVSQRSSPVTEALSWLPDTDGGLADAVMDDALLLPTPIEPAGGRILLADDNADLRDYVGRLLRARGYEVAINDPFKGVELMRMYSDPAQGRHSLQIELSKAVYLRPGTRERNERFDQVQAHLGELVAELSAA